MATSTFRNKNKVRPKKAPGAKRKRVKAQKRRLVALGVSEEKLRHMTPKDIRDALKHPHAISAELKEES